MGVLSDSQQVDEVKEADEAPLHRRRKKEQHDETMPCSGEEEEDSRSDEK